MAGYTYAQVYEASLEYFQGDELAAKVFVDKYALRDNDGNFVELTPANMHNRLAKEISRIEQKYPNALTEEEIYKLLENFKYVVLQGSPMSAIGNPHKLQSLGNCFVVESPYDSYGGICKTDQELAQLMKRRAGVGLDLSNIRPKGLSCNNAAGTTDGIGVFMERFSNTCREVAQNGRRGAELQSISIEHPEVETFIKIKQDRTKVTGANVSVRLTDEFMQAVKNETQFMLKWPVDSATPSMTKTVNAKDLWNTIIDCAWKSAEPGIFYWSNVIKNSPADVYASVNPLFRTRSSNPCFSGDERFLTENGYIKFVDSAKRDGGELLITDSRISYCNNGMEENPQNWKIDMLSDPKSNTRKGSNAFITKEDAPLLMLNFSNGQTLKCTPDHHIATSVGMIEAQFLTPDHEILVSRVNSPNSSIISKLPDSNLEIISFLAGLIAGDGTFSDNKTHIDLWGDDRFRMKDIIIDLLQKITLELKTKLTNGWDKRGLSRYYISENESENKIRISSTWLKYLLDDYLSFNSKTKFNVPEIIFNNARNPIGHFYMSGLFYADGSITKDINSGLSVRLSQSNKSLLRDVQMLCHANGILSSIYLRRLEHDQNFKGKIYHCKDQYELITTYGSWHRFINIIGFFGHPDKELSLNNFEHKPRNQQPSTNLISIEKINSDTVYCVKEDVSRSIIVNTISARRCGEIPMGVDSCRLTVVNLLSFVKNPFTDKAKFDYKLFGEVVIKAQRIMDDIIDLELEQISKIIKKVENDPEPKEVKTVELNLWKHFQESCMLGRRTGLGITALGDCLAALGIKYGSQDSIHTTEKIYKSLAINAYKSSSIMAGERGAFPLFNAKLEENHEYLSRVINSDDELKALHYKYGRRNIALTTTAPTGSVSVMTQTTSGIEPAYLLSYVRRKKINPTDRDVKVDFVDALGDKWQEFTVYHHGIRRWMDVSGEKDITKSPYWGATSNEIDWMASVDIQAAAQFWLCHAVSKTCNLPENVSKDVVSRVYMRAWEKGCKGFTVYRDKCRDGVLIQKSEAKNNQDGRPLDVETSMAPKRPIELPCDIRKAKINGEAWTIFVGLFNNKPYEIFGGLSKYVDIPNKYKIGKITKNGKVDGISTYNLMVDEGEDQMVIKDIANVFENSNFGAFTRTISLALRHGSPVQYVVEQLQKDKHSDITSFSKVIARVLKNYILDGTKSTAERKCPSCGKDDSFAYQEKCLTCMSCGWSKCS